MPNEEKQSRLKTSGRTAILTLTVALCVGMILVIGFFTPLRQWASPAPPPGRQGGATENAFLDGIRLSDGTPSKAIYNEWDAVRSDHKAIAYTVAQCFDQDVDRLPRNWFSGLLLDLHPSGAHYWAGADIPSQPENAHKLSELSSYVRTVLFLSDAIGRARIEAATGAGENWPQMIVFSWIVVIVSAFGTLFVTLRTSLTDKGKWTVFLTVAAVSLSTIGTVLTSAKTFYDPVRAYGRNERALLELQKLHQDVMLNFLLNWDPDPAHCDLKETAAATQRSLLARWVGELKDQHEGLVLAATGDIPLTVQKQVDTIGQPPISNQQSQAINSPVVNAATQQQPATPSRPEKSPATR